VDIRDIQGAAPRTLRAASFSAMHDTEADPELLKRWLDEEEELNDQQRARLERWRGRLLGRAAEQ